MTNFKNAIKEIAAAGRMGDDILVHMNRAELGGLASLAPGGKLSINPKTGLPEAFFFLPFLAGLGAAAAPAAAAAIPAAAAGAGALGAGMATGMAAALPAIAAPTAAGLSALPAAAAAALPTAATTATTAMPLVVGGAAPAAATGSLGAAPIASQLATMPGISSLTAGASSAAPSVGGLSSLPGGIGAAAPLAPGGSMTAATTIPGAGDLAAGIGPAAAAPGEFAAAAGGPGMTLSSPVSSIATPSSTAGGSALEAAQAGAYPGEYAAAAGGPGAPSMGGTVTPASEIAPVNAAMTTDPGTSGGLSGLLGGMDMNTALMGMAMAGQFMPMGGGGGSDEESDEDAGDEEYEGGDPVFPGDDYNPGTDDEWDYFPNYASGGIVHLEGGGGVKGHGWKEEERNRINAMGNPIRGGVKAPVAAPPPPTWTNTPYVPTIPLQGLESLPAANVPPMQLTGFNNVGDITKNLGEFRVPTMKRGGPVGYAAGGIAGMMPGQNPAMVPMPTDPMQAQGMMAQQGIGSLVPQMQPTPVSPLPKEQIGSKSGDESDKQIISDAVAAIQGQHPEPDKALTEFIQTFGEQALQDLVQRVKGAGPQGDGMSDSIPATIDGTQPAALSQGEFVVPADVVSGLGNGDTKAGSNQLFGMMDRVRTMRGGGPVQPPAINPSMVMPA